MIESWDELIDKVGPRPGMWLGRDKYSLVRSFVVGFGEARGDDVLAGFQHWIGAQPQNHSINNFAWWSVLLHEAFPDRDRPPAVSWDVDDPANEGWPLPPPAPVSEDELSEHEESIAIEHLFRRLREYLDSHL